MSQSMRQLAKCAQDAGLPVRLTREAAIIFEQSLMQREPPLSPHTIKIAFQHLRTFAAYHGSDEDFRDHLAARFRFHARRASRHSTRIDVKAMRVPDCKGVLETAFALLEEAASTTHLTTAHALRNRAATLALISPLPLRVADLTLYFGSNITWNGEAYHLFIPETSKTKGSYSATFHPVFGRFIDHLILAGLPEYRLEEARAACLREGRALFVNRWGEPCHRAYVSSCWHAVFGTGSHVARVKVHDAFARLGDRGVALALVVCAHSHHSGEFYRSSAFTEIASEYVLGHLAAEISEGEWKEFFN